MNGVLAQFWHRLEPKWRYLKSEVWEKSLVFREKLEPPAGVEPATC